MRLQPVQFFFSGSLSSFPRVSVDTSYGLPQQTLGRFCMFDSHEMIKQTAGSASSMAEQVGSNLFHSLEEADWTHILPAKQLAIGAEHKGPGDSPPPPDKNQQSDKEK